MAVDSILFKQMNVKMLFLATYYSFSFFTFYPVVSVRWKPWQIQVSFSTKISTLEKLYLCEASWVWHPVWHFLVLDNVLFLLLFSISDSFKLGYRKVIHKKSIQHVFFPSAETKKNMKLKSHYKRKMTWTCSEWKKKNKAREGTSVYTRRDLYKHVHYFMLWLYDCQSEYTFFHLHIPIHSSENMICLDLDKGLEL